MTRRSNELVDLVDIHGIPTGVLADRWDVPTTHPELCVPTVAVVIINAAGAIAVQQRAWTKRSSPGRIDVVCGGVTVGENADQAAHRETAEETGQRLDTLVKIHTVVTAPTDPQRRRRHRTIYLGGSEDLPAVHNPEEVLWTRFTSLDLLYQWYALRTYRFVERFFHDLAVVLPHHAAHAGVTPYNPSDTVRAWLFGPGT